MKTMRVMLMGALVVATGVLAACNGDGGSDGTATPSPTSGSSPIVTEATDTASPSVEDEVEAAYLRYWDVYADAVLNLDETGLEEVMTGAQLQRTLGEIGSLRQRGRAAMILVEHDVVVAELDAAASTASIRDRYTNSSYEVDAETKEAVGDTAPGVVLTDTYSLVKEGEAWKVRDGIRLEE